MKINDVKQVDMNFEVQLVFCARNLQKITSTSGLKIYQKLGRFLGLKSFENQLVFWSKKSTENKLVFNARNQLKISSFLMLANF